MQADVKESLGDYKSAATAYKRAIAEAPAADLGLFEVCTHVFLATEPALTGSS